MSGAWPGFSADWEESSEYQERKASLRRERQAREALKLRASAIVQAHQVCPECGLPVEESTRERAGVYYVDRVCPFCEWADVDNEGGI
jgi:hypothetical protein